MTTTQPPTNAARVLPGQEAVLPNDPPGQYTHTFGNPPRAVLHVTDAQGNHYCQLHPDRATELRCNRCGRYMCTGCIERTPVGYRCTQCVRAQEDKFFNPGALDYPIAAGVGLVVGAAGAFVAGLIGFIFFTLFIGLGAGGIAADLALRAIQRRRGRYTGLAVAVGIVVGTLVLLLGRAVIQYRALPNNDLSSYSSDELAALADDLGVSVRQLRANWDFFFAARPSLGDFLFTEVLNNWTLWIYAGAAAVGAYGRFGVRLRR